MNRKEFRNGGFSMVELIIVMAVIATLVAVMAPQYLKYVKKSKVSMDINNAQTIASEVGITVADNQAPLTLPAAGTTISVTVSDLPNIDAYPPSKVNPAYSWNVTLDSNNIVSVTLGGYEIWPDPDDAANGFRTMNY